MSIYASAVIGVADALTGASADAAYDAAYGTYYSAYTQMHNAASQKVAAEANISAITQDKINTNTVVGLQQDQAEAQAKVLAAVTGTTGGSVDSTIQQTEVNSSIAISNNAKAAEQQIENQLATVYSAQSTLLAVDDPQVADIDPIMAAVSTVAGSFSAYDMEQLGASFEGLSSDTDLDGMMIDSSTTSYDTGLGYA